MLDLLIGILATWRLTSLLHSEEGPFEIFARFRDWAGVRYDEESNPVSEKQIGKMLCCFWCTSIWSGLIVTILQVDISLIKTLGYSAGAILIDRFIRHG